jgi:hypothetical protein
MHAAYRRVGGGTGTCPQAVDDIEAFCDPFLRSATI